MPAPAGVAPGSQAGIEDAIRDLATAIAAGITATVTPAALGAGTSRSGSITTGGTAQDLAAANSSRKSLTGQNLSAADLWVNEDGGTAAADTANSYRVPAGASFSINTNEKVSIIGATTGQKFSATET